MPRFDEAARKYGTRGFVVVTINIEAREDALVAPFIKINGYTFQALKGTKEAQKAYGVEGVPRAFLIDRAGRIVFEPDPRQPERLRAMQVEIETLLDESAPARTTQLSGAPRND